jgi:hypothetical protein
MKPDMLRNCGFFLNFKRKPTISYTRASLQQHSQPTFESNQPSNDANADDDNDDHHHTVCKYDVHVTLHRRHSEGKEPTICDKVCSFYCLNMFWAPIRPSSGVQLVNYLPFLGGHTWKRYAKY